MSRLIYKCTFEDTHNTFKHSRKALLKYVEDKYKHDDLHLYNYGWGHYWRELTKLRKKIPNGTLYTLAQYKTKKSLYSKGFPR